MFYVLGSIFVLGKRSVNWPLFLTPSLYFDSFGVFCNMESAGVQSSTASEMFKGSISVYVSE